MSKPDVQIFIKCLNFAVIKHKDQRRMDAARTPYFNHVIGTAFILSSEANVVEQDLLMAAVLHDTVESTNTTFEEIEMYFGKVVRDLVEELTDDMSLSKSERQRLQVERAPNFSSKAKLLKLADKLNNLRDIEHAIPVDWSEDEYDQYLEWNAKLLEGLRGTNLKLEKEIEDILRRKRVIE